MPSPTKKIVGVDEGFLLGADSRTDFVGTLVGPILATGTIFAGLVVSIDGSVIGKTTIC